MEITIKIVYAHKFLAQTESPNWGVVSRSFALQPPRRLVNFSGIYLRFSRMRTLLCNPYVLLYRESNQIHFCVIAFSIFDWVKPWNGVKNRFSNFAIFYVYILLTLKEKSFPESVCVSLVVNFLSRDNSVDVSRIVLKIFMDICMFSQEPYWFWWWLLEVCRF